jgi:serine/threonine protein kinase
VLDHLHSKGIMHGDFYAHNLMIDDKANALLGDFGAATLYNTSLSTAELHQKLDVRAFGCLLDDLIIRTPLIKNSQHINTIIEQLIDKCLNETIYERLYFKDIIKQLQHIIV